METNGEQNTKPPACELVQGFERRILFKTVSSGVCGIAVGTLLAFRRPASSSILKSSLTSAASLSILSLAFSAAQEYTRALTCSDTPVNSAVGGAAAGALLFISHGGNPVLGAGIVAAMGCTIDMLYRSVGKPELDNVQGSKSSFFSVEKIVRKTTDEEREAFLEKRRRRVLRIDDTPS